MGSIIAMLLKWTGLSQGVMELIAVGVVVSGVGGFAAYEHHKILEEGVAKQHAADVVQAAKDTKILTVKAQTAETQHAKDLAALQAYTAANSVGAVSLCVSPLDGVQSDAASGSQTSGAVGAGTLTPGEQLQRLSAADSGVRQGPGPDIGPMLSALADAADKVNLQAIELQGIVK